MLFHWCQCDSKAPHPSRNLRSILADLYNTVTWMVSILPLISISSSLFYRSFGTSPREPSTISFTVILIFRSFFLVIRQGPSICLSFCCLNFFLCNLLERQNTLNIKFFFLLLNTWSGFLARIRRSVCILKFWRNLFSKPDFTLCIYYLVVWSNFNLLHNYQWITLLTLSSFKKWYFLNSKCF